MTNQRFERKGEYQRLTMRVKRARARGDRSALIIALRDLREAFPATVVGKKRRKR